MRNDRWATDSEIKAALRCFLGDKGTGGPVLYHHNGVCYVYDGEGHLIILGATGSGKSRRCVMAMIRALIAAGESFLVLDPKGEIFYETAGLMGGRYDSHVLDFRHICSSEGWNPLAAPYALFCSADKAKKQVAMEMLDELAHSLYPTAENTDPFWIDSARSLFVAIVSALFECADAEQVTMASVFRMISQGETRLGSETVLQKFTRELPEDSVAATLLQSYVNTADVTRAGIRSTFLEGISRFARSEALTQMLSSDDLCISRLSGAKPTGIYVILPDERPIFHKLAGILCSQILSHYIRLAQDKYGGKLPIRLNVCLEELGNIGEAIGTLPHLMSASRSRNIRIQCVLQSLSQLTDIYGPSKATTILDNANVTLAFRTNHWDTLTELSHKCGERCVSDGAHISREPLITQSQLGAMETGQALVMISGRTKFITWLPDYRDMFDFSGWKPPARRPPVKRKPVSAFDIAGYTKDRLREKLTSKLSPRTPCTVMLDTDDDWPSMRGDVSPAAMERFRAEIAEIEAKEARKNAGGGEPYDLFVESCGGHADEIARAIAAASKLSALTVSLLLKSDSTTFRFPSKAIAQAVQSKILSLGGMAAIKKVST